MLRKFLLPILILVTLLPLSFPAQAQEQCNSGTCIDVSTDPITGKITIHISKGAHGSAPKPRPAPTRRPQPPKPRPTYTHRSTPRPRPVIHRSPKATPVPDTFESDQLTQLIPASSIFYAPGSGGLTGIPVAFTSTSPSIFATQTPLLGVLVGLSLSTTYHWDFGDGNSISTASPTVTHSFSKVGEYPVTLYLSWAGTWSANGYTYDVLGGAIVQRYSTLIAIHQGPTHYHG